MKNLSRLTQVNLRDIWTHEEHEFTPWLAQAENIKLLSDTLNIGEIEVTSTERPVGKFELDIEAKITETQEVVIIENQLDITDHDHLGKIITYASGLNANFIIWIVSLVEEEHEKAIEWLNENTNDKVSFFLIKIEVFKIDDSPYAPKFEIVCKPNNWQRTIDKSNKATVSELKLKQLDFWNKYIEYVNIQKIKLRYHTPRPQHWLDLAIGTKEAHLDLRLNSKRSTIGIELYINNNFELFEKLLVHQKELNDLLNISTTTFKANKASGIGFDIEVENIFDKENYKWFYENSIKFKDYFSKTIKKYS